MKHNHLLLPVLTVTLLLFSELLFGIDPKDTRMLHQPATSASHIAFVYAEDLWVANADGSYPRRLTADAGIESNPSFSPDGALIAFSAQYDGNTDVFIVPVEGGVPRRLTWHPGADVVRGFTPDGKAVLFTSQRATFTNRYTQLFTVPVNGGFPTQLEIPNAFQATYSPDAKYMAYTPLSPAYQQWKNYRGGTISTLWIFSFSDHSVKKVPQPQEGCNDSDPVWLGDQIYFRSDRNGEFNLFSYNLSSGEVTQLTTYKDFPVNSLSGSGNRLVFQQAGYIHSFDIGSASATKLSVSIAADLLELRPRFVKGAQYVRSADISPSGARVVFDFRGDIITLPAEKGDPRNITSTTGVHEKYPAWSPDGKSIAYFSDASGEYALHIQPQDGKGPLRSIPIKGNGFYAFPKWSPDSKRITFSDNGRNLYVLEVSSGALTRIDNDEVYVPGIFRNLFGDWSHDSKWVAYTKVLETNFSQIFLYSIDQRKSFPLSDGLSDATNPVFDVSGKYLYFFASTDAGPVVNWFDQSNNDMRASRAIYLVTLQRNTISPLAKESDEEQGKTEPENQPEPEKKKGKDVPSMAAAKTEEFRIDFDGIQNRIIDLPIKPGNHSTLGKGKEGELYFVSRQQDGSGPGKLYKFDLKKRKDSEIMELDGYIISANGNKMLYRNGSTWGVTNTGEKPEAGKGGLKIEDIQVKIDPQTEWPNIFNEAWRVNRDYFYDPNMHGADWPAMKRKYEPLVADASCRSDLNVIIQWMCSELAVGHHRIGNPGDRLNEPKNISGGLLGADIVINNNRYQLKKIYGGLNWNPNLRSPLTEPGINARAGEYILAVNGKELTADINFYSMFENSADKIVELTIGPNPNLAGSRVVKVVPVANEFSLRNRDWVEGNLRKVNEATNGQVAYVYVPNTAGQGHEYFKRYFFPQANKKAIIVDERFNGGGQIADYYIDLLMRPYQAHWNLRYGKDIKTPSAFIEGPKVMLIDETAGSGGDMLPWMFRKFKVGTLIGKRTWGGLVGVLGFPEFIDGGNVTAPNLAIWTKDGFIVENVGVPPDIEVEQSPADVIKGRDPQLEKAIEVVLEQLKKNPPEEHTRPPYPVRVRKD